MSTGIGLAKQIIAIQKTMIHNGFKAQALWQAQSERAARALMRPAGGWPPQSEQLWHGWATAVQTGRDAVKVWVDAQFALVEGLLEGQRAE